MKKTSIEEEINVNKVKIFNKKTVSMLTYGSSKDVKNIYNYMYNNANSYLTRKKEKFLKQP